MNLALLLSIDCDAHDCPRAISTKQKTCRVDRSRLLSLVFYHHWKQKRPRLGVVGLLCLLDCVGDEHN